MTAALLAVHAFVAATSLMLWVRRRGSEYGSYALLSILLCLGLWQASALAQVTSEHSVARVVVILDVTRVLVLAALASFAAAVVHGVSEARAAQLVRASLAFAAISLTQVFAVPSMFELGPNGVIALPTVASWLSLVITFSLGSILLVLVFRRTVDMAALFVGIAAAIVLAGCVVDAGLRGRGGVHSLSVWWALALSGAVLSYLLLDRFVRAEQRFEARNADLRLASEELRFATTALVRSEQLSAMGELSAVIAAELHAPLLRLASSLDALCATSSLRDPSRFDAVDAHIEDATRVVRELLTFSKPMVVARGAVTLAELIGRAALHLPEGDRHILDAAEGSRSGLVYGDASLLALAIAHAAAFVSGGGYERVRVELSGVDGNLVLDVAVREVPVQWRPAELRAGGLTLAIVDRVVRAHGGITSVAASGVGLRMEWPARAV